MNIKPTIIECNDCGWRGSYPELQVRHKPSPLTYDIQPVFTCPKCDSEDIEEDIEEWIIFSKN